MLTRRDFLKATGMGILATAALKLTRSSIFEQAANYPTENEKVEVYGLDRPIKTEVDVVSIYAYNDILFEKRNNVKVQGDKEALRKEHLDPGTRYLEVVVPKSTYSNFSSGDNKQSFEEWVKIHVDLMNRCLKNAKPPSELKAKLNRIIVVEDELVEKIWNKDDWLNNNGASFDTAWRNVFESYLPVDTDTSWGVSTDIRTNEKQQNLWVTGIENGIFKSKITMSRYNPTTRMSSPIEFSYDAEDSVLDTNTPTIIDMNMIHEWSHYLLALPDEYTQDVYDCQHNGFARYLWSTGSFAIPQFDPYLSSLTKRNKEQKIRSMGNREFHDMPNTAKITIRGKQLGHNVTTEVRLVELIDSSIYGRKQFPPSPDYASPSNVVQLNKEMFVGDENSMLITIRDGGKSYPLFLPFACLNMCAIDGENHPDLEVILRQNNMADISFMSQEVVPVDSSDLASFASKAKENGWPIYATMEIPNTNTVFVWYLSNRIDTYYG